MSLPSSRSPAPHLIRPIIISVSIILIVLLVLYFLAYTVSGDGHLRNNNTTSNRTNPIALHRRRRIHHAEEGCQSVDTLPRYTARREGEVGSGDVAVPAPVAVAQVHVHFHGRKEGDGEGEGAGEVEGSKPPAYTFDANAGNLGTTETTAHGGVRDGGEGGGRDELMAVFRNGGEGGGRDELLASPATVHIQGK